MLVRTFDLDLSGMMIMMMMMMIIIVLVVVMIIIMKDINFECN